MAHTPKRPRRRRTVLSHPQPAAEPDRNLPEAPPSAEPAPEPAQERELPLAAAAATRRPRRDAVRERPLAAVADGKLWGEVDCYILEDGERIIAQRAILRSLAEPGKTRGAEAGNLGRLPSRFHDLTRGAEIAFTVRQPQGGVVRAIGRPPSFFVEVLRAYAEAFAAGELHATQQPLARRAIALLALLAEKGIEAMVDEACGVVRSLPAPQAPALLAAPALPAPSLALQRLDVADTVLGFLEQDLAMIERLEASRPPPERRRERTPEVVALVSAVHHGLAWVMDTLKATWSTGDQATRDRWSEVMARSTRVYQGLAPVQP